MGFNWRYAFVFDSALGRYLYDVGGWVPWISNRIPIAKKRKNLVSNERSERKDAYEQPCQGLSHVRLRRANIWQIKSNIVKGIGTLKVSQTDPIRTSLKRAWNASWGSHARPRNRPNRRGVQKPLRKSWHGKFRGPSSNAKNGEPKARGLRYGSHSK